MQIQFLTIYSLGGKGKRINNNFGKIAYFEFLDKKYYFGRNKQNYIKPDIGLAKKAINIAKDNSLTRKEKINLLQKTQDYKFNRWLNL